MNNVKSRGPLVDPGLCRCCGALKKCRFLNVEYAYMGQKEIYSEMFVDCFGLLLSHLDGEVSERLICATCVTRLRDANLFRQQVLIYEQKLLSTYIQHEDEKNSDIKQEEDIKVEMDDMSVDEKEVMMDNDCDDAESIETHSTYKKTNLISTENMFLHENRNKMDNLFEKNNANYVNRTNNIKNTEKHKIAEKPVPPDKLSNIKPNLAKNKSLWNATKIIENSYVIPFNTYFNDYYCFYCKQKFLDPEKLRTHTLTHDPTSYRDIVINTSRRGNKKCQMDLNRIDCRLCDSKIDNLDTFKIHIDKVHGKQIYTTTNIEDFIILKFRLTNSSLKCMECDRSFVNFHSLKQHMAEHFGDCVCDKCGAHYFEERMLVAHMKTHQPSEEKYPCNECSKTFKCKYNLTIHTARLHTKEAAYLCSKCDETFFSDTLRRRHMIQVHNEESTYKCRNCDKVYDNKRTLGDHYRRIHLKVMKHQCSLCEKRFFLPCRLKEHMSSHTGERNFRCEHCGKSYPRLRALKVHMQSHSAVKKFKCSLCSASYSQNVCLKNHIKRQHQSEDIEKSYQE